METIKKEFKGTKGEWRVVYPSVNKALNPNDPFSIKVAIDTVATVPFDDEYVEWMEEAEANAKLIAAAPDLLEALQQINIDLKILKENILYESERLENTRFDGYADVIGAWISLNEQAIEKAL